MNIATLTNIDQNVAQLIDFHLLNHIFLYRVEQLRMLIYCNLNIKIFKLRWCPNTISEIRTKDPPQNGVY